MKTTIEDRVIKLEENLGMTIKFLLESIQLSRSMQDLIKELNTKLDLVRSEGKLK